MVTAYRGTYIRPMASDTSQSVPIRLAATVVVVRDSVSGPLVLLVRRDHKAVFMGGARVFPGGAIDEVDNSDRARAAVAWSGPSDEFGWRAAALRELFEEAGILIGFDEEIDQRLVGADFYSAVAATGRQLNADALTYFANWVTPVGPRRRFDARFYLARGHGEVITDDQEVFDAVWASPSEALAFADRGEWQLEFPTRATLTMLTGYPNAVELIADHAARQVTRMEPRIGRGVGGSPRVLLPGDAGYESAPA
jgi:8-oxo-dGTP pyrophosphatase MutT (NUDIX family)